MSKNTEISKEDHIWVDGCYDMVHFGHANSLRQAKLLGKKLSVGIHTGEEIAKHKGPPVFTDEERVEMISSIKWVDEVVLGAPYVTTLETLDKYNCQYCAHGDDLTMDVDGNDTYRHVKEAGRYKEFRRTQGVSTTDIVGRMLLATTRPRRHSRTPSERESSNLIQGFADKTTNLTQLNDASNISTISEASEADSTDQQIEVMQPRNNFLATTQKIKLFCDSREATPRDTVVYVSGAFDVFHNGHLSFLRECAKLGTYLMVGVHSDDDVAHYSKEPNLPIMGVSERTLSLLACKYVNEVVIGAPLEISAELIKQFNIKFVCHGKRAPNFAFDNKGNDPYEVAKEKGIFREIDSGSDLSTSVIIDRILKNRKVYLERNKKKMEKEKKVQEVWEQGRQEHGIEFSGTKNSD